MQQGARLRDGAARARPRHAAAVAGDKPGLPHSHDVRGVWKERACVRVLAARDSSGAKAQRFSCAHKNTPSSPRAPRARSLFRARVAHAAQSSRLRTRACPKASSHHGEHARPAGPRRARRRQEARRGCAEEEEVRGQAADAHQAQEEGHGRLEQAAQGLPDRQVQAARDEARAHQGLPAHGARVHPEPGGAAAQGGARERRCVGREGRGEPRRDEARATSCAPPPPTAPAPLPSPPLAPRARLSQSATSWRSCAARRCLWARWRRWWTTTTPS